MTDNTATIGDSDEISRLSMRYSIDDWSIDGIMDHIEDVLNEKPCGPNGCDCDGYVIPNVEYDAVRGFPNFLIYRTTGNTGSTACPELGIGAIGYVTDGFNIEAIEPLP